MVSDVAFCKMPTEASSAPPVEKTLRVFRSGSQEPSRQRQDSSQKLSVLQEMQALQTKLETDIQHQETKIYEMEGDYLAATADVGNMIKGWEGYLCEQQQCTTSTVSRPCPPQSFRTTVRHKSVHSSPQRLLERRERFLFAFFLLSCETIE